MVSGGIAEVPSHLTIQRYKLNLFLAWLPTNHILHQLEPGLLFTVDITVFLKDRLSQYFYFNKNSWVPSNCISRFILFRQLT